MLEVFHPAKSWGITLAAGRRQGGSGGAPDMLRGSAFLTASPAKSSSQTGRFKPNPPHHSLTADIYSSERLQAHMREGETFRTCRQEVIKRKAQIPLWRDVKTSLPRSLLNGIHQRLTSSIRTITQHRDTHTHTQTSASTWSTFCNGLTGWKICATDTNKSKAPAAENHSKRWKTRTFRRPNPNSFSRAAHVYQSSWPGDNHVWPTFCQLSDFTITPLFFCSGLYSLTGGKLRPGNSPDQQKVYRGLHNDALEHERAWRATLHQRQLHSHKSVSTLAMEGLVHAININTFPLSLGPHYVSIWHQILFKRYNIFQLRQECSAFTPR